MDRSKDNPKSKQGIESKIKGLEEEFIRGKKLFDQGRYDKAITFFKSRQYLKDHLMYYGLAAVTLQKKKNILSKEETEDLIDTCQKAIDINPEHAPSHYLQGVLYLQQACSKIKTFAKDDYQDSSKNIIQIKESLRLSKEKLEQSIKIDPRLENFAFPEIEKYGAKLRWIDYIEKKKEQQRPSSN